MAYRVGNRRVTKLRVRHSDDGLEIHFLGQSARGTPFVLGGLKSPRRDVRLLLSEAEASGIQSDDREPPIGV